ncbi:carbohydrate esterase family 4 protein [Daldinia eschscholtzii]|nr:carbohydrate esterase family 4 protein [Daldinia eschscholtzii]
MCLSCPVSSSSVIVQLTCGCVRLKKYSSPPKGTPLFNMSRPHIGDVPYGQAIFSCANPGQVALTFDDGPYFWTSQIVDLLDDLNIKATFFVTGNNLDINRRIDKDQEYQYLLWRMRLSGHQIASHSWTHRHLEDIGREGRFQEMVYNEMALRTATGAPPSYMRPPYGEWRDADEMRDLGALGYHVIMYNLDTKDYKHDTERDIDVSIGRFNDALREDGHGSYIILAHDVHKWTALKLVPAMVNTIISRGYKAVTVGECLNDDEFNWYRDPFDIEH